MQLLFGDRINNHNYCAITVSVIGDSLSNDFYGDCCDRRHDSFLGSHHLLPELFAHTYDRIRLVRDPFLDPYGKGFQMSNSYYALYNGGFFGRGQEIVSPKRATFQLPKRILCIRFWLKS